MLIFFVSLFIKVNVQRLCKASVYLPICACVCVSKAPQMSSLPIPPPAPAMSVSLYALRLSLPDHGKSHARIPTLTCFRVGTIKLSFFLFFRLFSTPAPSFLSFAFLLLVGLVSFCLHPARVASRLDRFARASIIRSSHPTLLPRLHHIHKPPSIHFSLLIIIPTMLVVGWRGW